MLPSSFRPDGTYDLVRLGKDHDGGYLVEAQSLRQTARLLAFGLSDDWSFEKDFLRRRPVPLASFPVLYEVDIENWEHAFWRI